MTDGYPNPDEVTWADPAPGDWDYDPNTDPEWMDPAKPRLRIETDEQYKLVADCVVRKRKLVVDDCEIVNTSGLVVGVIIEDLSHLIDFVQTHRDVIRTHSTTTHGFTPTSLWITNCIVNRCDLTGRHVRIVFLIRAKFTSEVWFNRVKFGSTAQFSLSHFTGDAHFDSCRFDDTATFARTTFRSNAWFHHATFGHRASFNDAHFCGRVEFLSSTFDGIADFSSSNFFDTLDFFDVEFTTEVGFGSCVFRGPTTFHKVTITGFAQFESSVFLSDTRFAETQFLNTFLMSSTKICDNMLFFSVKFMQRAWFNKAMLTRDSSLNFFQCRLQENISFNQTIIRSSLLFNETTFEQRLMFDNCLLGKTARLAFPLSLVRGAGTIELRKNQLLRTDRFYRLSRFWRLQMAIHPALVWLGLKRPAPLMAGEDSDNIDKINRAADDYELLAANYQNQPATDWEEDWCRWQAHELRRRANLAKLREDTAMFFQNDYSPSSKLTKYALETRWCLEYAELMWQIAKAYGVLITRWGKHIGWDWFVRRTAVGNLLQTHRIVVSSFAILILGAILYGTFAEQNVTVIPDQSIPMPEGVLERARFGLYFSLTTFVTLGYGDYSPTGWFKLLTGAQAFLGVTLLALFTVAWGRKMIR